MEAEDLGGGITVFRTAEHRFGTDALLLSAFAAPRRGELACDLCSGCGVVAARWFCAPLSAPARVWCVELAPQAAALIEACARASGLEDRLTAVCGDLRELLLPRAARAEALRTLPLGRLDVVSANPPYFEAGRGAASKAGPDRLARHETACTLPDVCRAGARLLRFGGRLCLCQRPERLPDALEAMRRAGAEPKRLRFVQQNACRAPWLFLLEGRRGARPSLRIEAPLLLSGPD